MQSNQTMDKAVAVFDELKTKATETKDKVLAKSVQTKDRAIVILRNPEFQKATLCTGGGSITFGAVGGAFGLASGVVVGSTVGLVPALFTFGLSIPVGGAIGGAGGLCAGTLIGGTSGGAAGFTVYKYRIEINKGMWTVKVKAYDLLGKAKTGAIKAYNGTSNAVSVRAYKFQVSINDLANKAKRDSRAALALAKLKASKAYQVTTETRAGVTAASAVTGAVVGGTGGGAVGTVAGAAIGIVPAIFTFGLSIPAGAMIGLCAGTTIGGGAGAVGGGVVGFTGYTVKQNYGKAIAEGFQSSLSKAGNLKNKTFMRAAEAKESMKSMVKGSTGGSGHDKTD